MTGGIRTRGARVLLPLGSLLALSGCATLGLEHPPTATYSLPTVEKPPANSKSPAAGGSALTDAQAQAALVTESDLGSPWTAAGSIATWRDGMLKARSEVAECQRLLDALYSDQVLGAPARVAVALDDPDAGAQLRYQIGARRPSDVDADLKWLGEMPAKCARFTATTQTGWTEDVQVSDLPLPEVGDKRQGLRVTLTATDPENPDADEQSLTLELAAARVGEDAFALTNGSTGDVPNDATQAAVQIGALRLADVRRQGRAQV
ncbi:hypothetical protein D0Z67_15190 [Streptomyces seoulensis]|uniref:Lipoprotein n=1 Tax=Streptomyces seoulensis TaxID=73044 RepID=A0A4P6U0I8_STRSO|nr:hypothetical protein [Streptomyces seoulensis]QBJ91498.1 hypothetical protein D0Z67_15190 [Streptomyces seoulensis]